MFDYGYYREEDGKFIALVTPDTPKSEVERLKKIYDYIFFEIEEEKKD